MGPTLSVAIIAKKVTSDWPRIHLPTSTIKHRLGRPCAIRSDSNFADDAQPGITGLQQ